MAGYPYSDCRSCGIIVVVPNSPKPKTKSKVAAIANCRFFEEPQIDYWIDLVQLPEDGADPVEHGDNQSPEDESAAKPLVDLPAVEEYLKRGGAQAH
jgi:hypothetical protein